MTPTDTELDRQLEKVFEEHFYESHSDSDSNTCLSLYLISKGGRRQVYVYNASSHEKAEYSKQPCDCGVDKNRAEFKAQIKQLIARERLDELGRLDEIKRRADSFVEDVYVVRYTHIGNRIAELEASLKEMEKS